MHHHRHGAVCRYVDTFVLIVCWVTCFFVPCRRWKSYSHRSSIDWLTVRVGCRHLGHQVDPSFPFLFVLCNSGTAVSVWWAIGPTARQLCPCGCARRVSSVAPVRAAAGGSEGWLLCGLRKTRAAPNSANRQRSHWSVRWIDSASGSDEGHGKAQHVMENLSE